MLVCGSPRAERTRTAVLRYFVNDDISWAGGLLATALVRRGRGTRFATAGVAPKRRSPSWHKIGMFDRPNALTTEGFEGSGAEWLERYKPCIEGARRSS